MKRHLQRRSTIIIKSVVGENPLSESFEKSNIMDSTWYYYTNYTGSIEKLLSACYRIGSSHSIGLRLIFFKYLDIYPADIPVRMKE